MSIKCKKHPRYQGKKKPRSECPACLRVWKIKNLDPAELKTFSCYYSEEPTWKKTIEAMDKDHAYELFMEWINKEEPCPDDYGEGYLDIYEIK